MGKFKALRPLIESFVANGPAGAACAVTHRGETVFQEYVGYADVDTQQLITPDTIYRIYSMTKIITCTAALKLFERGQFLLNDPLAEYLPEFANPQVYRTAADGTVYTSPASSPIRVKDMFTMSSGITYGGERNETERHTGKVMDELHKRTDGKYDVRQLSKTLASVPLAFDPGSQWKYGLSHDVLGAFIEVLSGKSFGQFLQEEIFDPLGMKDTFFRIPDEKKHHLSSFYNRSEDGILTKSTELDAHIQPDATFESRGGGLLSTLGDYSTFAYMLAAGGTWQGERILSRKTIQLMSTNHLEKHQMPYYNWPYLAGYGYGLGVRVMVEPQLGGSNSSLGEFGWSGMLGTWALIDPTEELSAVYMQQMFPNFEAVHQPRLRNAIYGAL